MKESDLIYLATMVLLSTRGGVIGNQDIAKAKEVATKVYRDFFGIKERADYDTVNHVLAAS